jgi:ribose transport system substrate-binding protein
VNRNLQRGKRRAVVASLAAFGLLALAACSSTPSAEDEEAPAAASSAAAEAPASEAPADEAAADTTVTVGESGSVDQFIDISEVCGDTPVTVGVVDGYGTNAWSKTVLAEIESEAAKCPSVTNVEFAAGRGDLAATTSAITSMAAKGTDLILVIPDAGPGEAHLPALQTATDAGSTVVAFASDPVGTRGVEYFDYTDHSPEYIGRSWAQWVVDQLGPEGGSVAYLGGPAGALVSEQQFAGVKEVLDANPQITLLTEEPVVTNWDPAQGQQAMAGLIAAYPEIDALIVDYGAVANAVIRAYEAAGKPVPPIATTDDNSLSCGFEEVKAANPTYELATVSSRTWVGRVALRKGLAKLEGLGNSEPSVYNLEIFEDSTGRSPGAKSPSEACLPDAPPDATPSSLLTSDELAAIFQ